MSGPKCDVFSLNEEEQKRQQEELERRLEEERLRICEEKAKRRRFIEREAEDTLELLQKTISDPLKKEFEMVYSEYQASAILAEEEADTFEYSQTNASLVIAKMKESIKKWKEISLARSCEKRVDEIIHETIEEMGYELIGEKRGAVEDLPNARLYEYDKNTSISVIAANGQFTMEVVAVDETDRAVTEKEAEHLEECMGNFCEDYEQFKNHLATKNIIHATNIFHMPPDKSYARILNASSYFTDKNWDNRNKKKRKVYADDYMKEIEQGTKNGQKKV